MSSTGPLPLLAATLVFCNVLSGTLLIPVVRPFLASLPGASENAVHAFFAMNMLGAAVGAPLLCRWADRRGNRKRMAVVLSMLDGLLLLGCAMTMDLGVILALRTVQGAASVGALSLLMGQLGSRGSEPAGEPSPGVWGPRRHRPASIGLAGGAIIAAIAAGAPLGGMTLRHGVSVGIWMSALLALAVALGCMLQPFARPGRSGDGDGGFRSLLPRLWVPALWLGGERFTVGCFVVTFGVYAHNLGYSDGDVARLYSLFLIPFALAAYPATRLADRYGRALVLSVGATAYGCAFIGLSLASAGGLGPLLLVAGLASAAIYGPTLRLTAGLCPDSARATGMGLVNAAGTLGMMLGTAFAGVLSAALGWSGMLPQDAQGWVLRLAGLAQIGILIGTARALQQIKRAGFHVATQTA